MRPLSDVEALALQVAIHAFLRRGHIEKANELDRWSADLCAEHGAESRRRK